MQMIWVSSPGTRNAPVLAVIFGVILLFFSPFIPGLIGIFLAAAILILSLSLIGLGFSLRNTGFFLPLLAIGIIGGVLSLYALLTPDTTVSFMGMLLGFVMLIMGIGQLFFSPSFVPDRLSWFFLVCGGVLTILVGLYLILSPREGMQIVTIFLGCYLLLYGLIGLLKRRKSYYEPVVIR